MGQINLLPWREGYRKYLNRIFFIWLGLVSLVSLILVLIWVYVVAMVLEKQQLRNAYITDKSVEMDESTAEINRQKNKRQQILSFVKAIQDLQNGRTEIVRIFDELARAVPDGVYLTKLERVAETITLYGVSESNNQLSVLIRNLQQQSFKYDNANLIKMEHSGRKLNQISTFNFQVIIRPSDSERL